MAKKSEKKIAPKSMDELRKLIDKDYGSGSLMIGRGAVVNVEVFPTNITSLDNALGVAGLPLGRIIELFGTESSGKTTTCLEIVAACQKHYFAKKERYGVAGIIDAEHALDPEWAMKIGVDMDKLAVSQPDSGEDGLNILETMIDSGLFDLIVVDSVAALTPKAILEGEMGDKTMAALAQLMSQGMGKIKAKCNKTKTTVIFINQIREKVGVMFGNPESTPGGRALKFYASLRIEVRKGEALKEDDNVVGFRPKVKIIKNKVAPPFTTAEYDICVGKGKRPNYGIDKEASLLDVAESFDIITRNKNFIIYDSKNLGNGFLNAVKTIRADTQLYEEIKKKTYERMCDKVAESATEIAEDGFDEEEEED